MDTLNKILDFIGRILPLVQAMPRWFQVAFLLWLGGGFALVLVGISIQLLAPPKPSSLSFKSIDYPPTGHLRQIAEVLTGGAEDPLGGTALNLRQQLETERQKRSFNQQQADRVAFTSTRLPDAADSLKIMVKEGTAAWCAVGFLQRVGEDTHLYLPPTAIGKSHEFSREDLKDVSWVIVWLFPLSTDAETALVKGSFADVATAQEWMLK